MSRPLAPIVARSRPGIPPHKPPVRRLARPSVQNVNHPLFAVEQPFEHTQSDVDDQIDIPHFMTCCVLARFPTCRSFSHENRAVLGTGDASGVDGSGAQIRATSPPPSTHSGFPRSSFTLQVRPRCVSHRGFQMAVRTLSGRGFSERISLGKLSSDGVHGTN